MVWLSKYGCKLQFNGIEAIQNWLQNYELCHNISGPRIYQKSESYLVVTGFQILKTHFWDKAKFHVNLCKIRLQSEHIRRMGVFLWSLLITLLFCVEELMSHFCLKIRVGRIDQRRVAFDLRVKMSGTNYVFTDLCYGRRWGKSMKRCALSALT